MGIINDAKSRGYTISILYFWLKSPELAIARVKSRVEAGGHNIPENVVRRRYYMGLNYFFETYAPVCDRWLLADNSVSPFIVVAEGSPSGIKVKDKERYDTILHLAYPDENEE
jgi:predicted ABC-type ATPase